MQHTATPQAAVVADRVDTGPRLVLPAERA
jgi:hypothetical protein